MGASDKYCSIDNVLLLSFERLTDTSKFKFLSVASSTLQAWPRLFLAPALPYDPPFFKKAQDHLHPEAVAPLILAAVCAPTTKYTNSFILCLLGALSTSSCPASLCSKLPFPFRVPFFCLLLLIYLCLFLVLVWLVGFLVVTKVVVMVFH